MRKISITVLLTLALTTLSPLGSIGSAFASETQPLDDGSWTVAVSQDVVKVDWNIDNESAQVQVVTDENETAQGGETGSVEFSGQAAGDEVQVSLTVSTPISDVKAQEISKIQSLPVETVLDKYAHASVRTISLTVPKTGTAVDSAQAATSLPSSTIFRYQTFIPTATIDAPAGACTPNVFQTYVFKADNRTYSPTSSAFKTRFDVSIDWPSGGSLRRTALVGETIRYLVRSDGSLAVDARDTAPNTSMVLSLSGVQSSSVVEFRVRQDVENPLCNSSVTNGIYFNYLVRIWRSGGYSMDGEALRMPNHEAYRRDSNDGIWSTIFKRNLYSVQCLATLWSGTQPCKTSQSYVG